LSRNVCKKLTATRCVTTQKSAVLRSLFCCDLEHRTESTLARTSRDNGSTQYSERINTLYMNAGWKQVKHEMTGSVDKTTYHTVYFMEDVSSSEWTVSTVSGEVEGMCKEAVVA